MAREIKTDNFLEFYNKPGSREEHMNLCLLTYKNGGEIAAKQAVEVVNQFQDRLGFFLAMVSKPSKTPGFVDITFIPSQPVHEDFFHSQGVFRSTISSINIGINMVEQVSPEDAQAIFLAEMTGKNTMQFISDELQHSSVPEPAARWQNIMGKIS